MTRLRMNGNIDLRIAASFEEAEELWRTALAEGAMLHVETADGQIKAVNPHQVLYLEAAAEEPVAARAAVNGRAAEPATA